MLHKLELMPADQANDLVYSSYEMTLNEKRLLMLAICKLSRDMKAFPLMSVKISDLKEYLEIEGESLSSNLRKVCLKLLKRIVQIENDQGDWKAYQWVSQCEITKGTGVLEIELHKNLKPYLLELGKHYQSISFEQIAQIHKAHAVRIYEILWHKRMEMGLPRNKFKIGFDDLHRMLALGKTYKVFAYFKKRILDPAQKELEKSTPIQFTYKVERYMRKVVFITFTVFTNDDYKAEKLPPLTAQMMLDLNETDIPEDRKRIINGHVFKHFNHSSWDAEITQFKKEGRTIEQIEKSASWAVADIDKKSKTNKPVKNPAAYLRWAVREGKY